jgi:pimeloyl-ACP methyl ester carboxylesterase
MITWSTGDRLNPLAVNRPGIARLRHGALLTFRGGHAPFLECPAEFDAAFARFAAGLP